MTTDRYTKFVLTVIALCLLFICYQNLGLRSVKAQEEQRGVIAGIDPLPRCASCVIPIHIMEAPGK
jgi:hypothetical protein